MPRRRRLFRLRLRKDSLISITAVVLLLFAALTFVSFFAQADAGSFWQDLLNKLFGWASVLTPFILAIVGLLLLGQNLSFLKTNTLAGLVLFLVSFTTLSHLVLFRGPNSYDLAALGQGGGLLGFFLSQVLIKFATPLGAFLVAVSFLVISLLVLFNTSFAAALGFARQAAHLLAKPGRYLLDLVRGKGVRKFRDEKGAGLGVVVGRAPAPGSLDGEGAVDTPREKLKVEVLPRTLLVEKTAVAKGPSKDKIPLPPETQSGLVQETVKNLPLANYVWEYPPVSLLSDSRGAEANRGDVAGNAQIIEGTLDSFGIKAKVVEVNSGPAVTQYALESAQGTKIARIKNLQNDLAMALASPTGTIRIEAPIPGKSLIGVETPNLSPAMVNLKTILSSDSMTKNRRQLLVALGLDVSGKPVVADVARMPHVLVAGSTGSGKSTLIHACLASLLFRNSPEELKFILVDTKRVELTEYNDIPHLLTPVITEAEKVLAALKWSMAEMERRYRLFQSAHVRNIDSYNEISGFQALPYIVILVDEMADMMQMAPVEVEKAVCRLAQMARATGLHLILSTQRPSVDVLTGLIKANIPARIAFNVTSQIDSRVIIDQTGAEKLLGRGDMLYLPPESSKPVRIQGVFVSSLELRNLIDYLKNTQIKPEYQEEVISAKASSAGGGDQGSRDDLFSAAVRAICEYDRASSSLLQRRLKIGYARAARLLDEMEERGIVGAASGSKPRDVLIHDPAQVLPEPAGFEDSEREDNFMP